MPKLGVVLLILLFIAFFVWWIRTAVAFDRALQRLFETDREKWVDLDRPAGFFWWPGSEVKGRFFQSTNARNGLVFEFLFNRRKFLGKLGLLAEKDDESAQAGAIRGER